MAGESVTGRVVVSVQQPGAASCTQGHLGTGVMISPDTVLLRPPDVAGVPGGPSAAAAWRALVAPSVADRFVAAFDLVAGPSDLGTGGVTGPVERRRPEQVEVVWPAGWQVQPFAVLVTLAEPLTLPAGAGPGAPPAQVRPTDTLWGLLTGGGLAPDGDEIDAGWLAAADAAGAGGAAGAGSGAALVPWSVDHRPPLAAPAAVFGRPEPAVPEPAVHPLLGAAVAPAGMAQPDGFGCWIMPWRC